jgi:hypothetical protein
VLSAIEPFLEHFNVSNQPLHQISVRLSNELGSFTKLFETIKGCQHLHSHSSCIHCRCRLDLCPELLELVPHFLPVFRFGDAFFPN